MHDQHRDRTFVDPHPGDGEWTGYAELDAQAADLVRAGHCI